MRYFVGAILGFFLGAVTVAAGIYLNPFAAENPTAPVNTRVPNVLQVTYGSATVDSIAYINGGSKYLPRRPAYIDELWHPNLQGAHAAIHALRDDAGDIVGVGVKFGAWSEDTRVLSGELLMDSVWNLYVPGTGSFFVEQRENYWPLFRSVALPALLSDGKQWTGTFYSDLTVGPSATLEGLVVGASGVLRGHRGEARESIRVADFSMGAQHTTDNMSIERSLLIATEFSQAAESTRVSHRP